MSARDGRSCSTSATSTSRRSRTTDPRSSTRSTARCATELNAAWERFRADDDAWVAIVTGAGRAFCVGADLQDGAGVGGHVARARSGRSRPSTRSSRAWRSGSRRSPRSTATASATASRWSSACDFVIAADDAEFGMPEVRLGVPTIVGAMRLPQRVGMQPALELLLTGDRIDAARAQRDRPRRVGRAARRAARRGPPARATGSARARRSRSGRSRRWRTAASTCRGSTRCGWARRCAASRAADRRRPRRHGRRPRGPRPPLDGDAERNLASGGLEDLLVARDHRLGREPLGDALATRRRRALADPVDRLGELVDRRPQEPGLAVGTISVAAPRGHATTGVPHAIASIITSPNGSGHWIGNTIARARAEQIGLHLVVDALEHLDVVVQLRRDRLVPVRELERLVALHEHLERQPRSARDLDRLDRSLVGVRPPDVDEVVVLVLAVRVRRRGRCRCAPSPRSAGRGSRRAARR